MSSNPTLETYRNQIASTRQMALAMFESVDQLERLLVDSMRCNTTDQMDFLQSLAASRDAQEASTLCSNYCAHMPEQLLRTHQELLRIAAQAQAELGRVLQSHVTAQAAAGAGENGAAQAAAADGQPMAAMLSFWEQRFKEASAAADQWLRTVATEPVAPAAAKPANGAPRAARRRTQA